MQLVRDSDFFRRPPPSAQDMTLKKKRRLRQENANCMQMGGVINGLIWRAPLAATPAAEDESSDLLRPLDLFPGRRRCGENARTTGFNQCSRWRRLSASLEGLRDEVTERRG